MSEPCAGPRRHAPHVGDVLLQTEFTQAELSSYVGLGDGLAAAHPEFVEREPKPERPKADQSQRRQHRRASLPRKAATFSGWVRFSRNGSVLWNCCDSSRSQAHSHAPDRARG